MRRQVTPIVLLSALLAGCPVPEEGTSGSTSLPAVPSGDAGKAGKAGGPGAGGPGAGGPGAGGPGAGGPGAGGPGAGTPGSATGGVLMVLEQMPPQQTQEALQETGDTITITGEVTGECSGTIRIDVIDESLAGAPPSPDGGVPGPLTIFTMDGTGPFSLLAPKGKSVNLTALCDNDQDGKISNSVDGLSLGAKLGELTADKDGVSLEVSILSAVGIPGGAGAGGAGAGGAGGPGAGGPGAGGPGAGGPGAGGPGAGGPGAGGPGAGGPGAGGPGAGGPDGVAPGGDAAPAAVPTEGAEAPN